MRSAACSASTARTPNPSSAHSTLPMPELPALRSDASFDGRVTRCVTWPTRTPQLRIALISAPCVLSRRNLPPMELTSQRRAARAAACMSHASCRCIQNIGSLSKNRASRSAVSAVMARRPRISSLTRRRDTPSAAASSVWVMPSGARNLDSRNFPGCGGVRDATTRAPSARRLRPRRHHRIRPRLAGRPRLALEHADAVDHRADHRLAAHHVLAEHHVHVDEREQQQVPHRRGDAACAPSAGRRRPRRPSR